MSSRDEPSDSKVLAAGGAGQAGSDVADRQSPPSPAAGYGYRLQDLIDIPLFQSLQDGLNEIYSFPSAIIDNDGQVLTATGWQDACTKFHRAHPECARECEKSDRYILEHLAEAAPAVTYRCPHGLVDTATPIIIEGRHLANFFTGQFFLASPDLEWFRRQAHRYGFDEDAYLEAIGRVPVWTEDKLARYLDLIKGVTEILAGIGYKHLKEMEARRVAHERSTALADVGVLNQQIIESVEEGVVVYGRDLRYQVWNRYMETLSGLAAGDVLGKHPLEVFPFLRGTGVVERIEDALRGVAAPALDFPFRLPSGKSGWSSDTSAPLYDRDGHIVGVIATVRDTTERRRAEEERSRLQAELFQAQKMESIGTLAGGIAHDFNNLLAGIMGGLDVLETVRHDGEAVRAEIAEMKALVRRGADLSRELLGFARRGKLHTEAVALDSVLHATCRLFARTRRGTTVDFEPVSPLPPIIADRTQVQQAVLNLLVNASDAMGEAGRVTLRTALIELDERDAVRHGVAAGRYVQLTVADTGAGMDPQTRERIFEPFFTTKAMGRGTGLGLASVFGIVRNHGGFITVESRVGEGSVFVVHWPVTDLALAQPTSRGAPLSPGRETILVVDDEPSVLRTLRRILGALGYEVVVAAGGEEACALLRERSEPVALVLLDMVMPEMGGRETWEALRAIDPNLKVLVSSGYSLDAEVRSLMDCGGSGFIQKPFDAEELSRKLREVLDG